ncbi:MAG: hypothetical protein JWL95_625 [Gemmatimonadetes bacterium]|nr:hypothetical protein [Gemmatimonadota bacterium]
MGYRVFRDSRGAEWQAWDVIPQLTERREIERRMQRVPVEHADRRRDPDRRHTKGRRPVLTAGLDNGWLCFETNVEKRRLAPIPLDWLRCTEAQLERYCESAKRAPRPSTAAELTDIARIRR